MARVVLYGRNLGFSGFREATKGFDLSQPELPSRLAHGLGNCFTLYHEGGFIAVQSPFLNQIPCPDKLRLRIKPDMIYEVGTKLCVRSGQSDRPVFGSWTHPDSSWVPFS